MHVSPDDDVRRLWNDGRRRRNDVVAIRIDAIVDASRRRVVAMRAPRLTTRNAVVRRTVVHLPHPVVVCILVCTIPTLSSS